MANVFLSYAKEDTDFASRLAGAIEARGYSVFWDRDIPPGRTWHDVIDKEITAAGCVVVVWSPESAASHWVKEEAEEGRMRDLLVPVLFRSPHPPFGFRGIQAVDLRDWDSSHQHAALESLLRSVNARVSMPGSQDPAPDLAGIWQGNWDSVAGDRRHDCSLFVPANHEEVFDAALVVTYLRERNEKQKRTVVHELVRGTLKGTHVRLSGRAFVYVSRGNAARYTLDEFDLGVDEERDELDGFFKKGDQEAPITFRRVKHVDDPKAEARRG